jgi:outer membrane lipoprotein-sorting protein
MKLKITLFILLTIFIRGIHAQSNEPEKIVKNFFDLYKQNRIEQALDYLFSSNPILYNKSESIKNLKNTFTNIEKVLGGYKDYSISYNQEHFESLKIIITYVRYEKQPLRLLFVFYKPGDKWIMYRFEIDTKFPENFINQVLKENGFITEDNN